MTIRYLLLAIALGACGTDSSVGPGNETSDVRLSTVSGQNGAALQNAALADAVVVLATNAEGFPQSGFELRARVVAGGGSVRPETSITDERGRASFEWTLGEAYDQELRVFSPERSAIRTEVHATTRYRYSVPAALGDGWPTGKIDTTSVYAANLFEAIDHIRGDNTAKLHSLLIIQNDSLRFEGYWPGLDSGGNLHQFDRTVPHEMQSASKSYRSALIGIAIDQGFIRNVDQPIFEFFPDKAHLFDEQKRRITLGDLLTMRSGLEWDETGAAQGQSNNSLSQMYLLPAGEWTDYVLSRSMAFEPGEQFVYNTGASIMLADILGRASGMSVAGFVRQYYSTPVGSPSMNTSGASLIPRDMAKLGQVFLDEGLWKGQRIVSEAWVDASLSEHVQVNTSVSYGFQWWMATLSGPAGRYRARYANGNGGQIILVIDELDLVVASTAGNFGSGGSGQLFPIVQSGILGLFE